MLRKFCEPEITYVKKSSRKIKKQFGRDLVTEHSVFRSSVSCLSTVLINIVLVVVGNL